MISQTHADSTAYNLKISGDITKESLGEFREQLESIEKNKLVISMNAVQLKSRGGNGTAAREIAKLIRAKRLNTYVAEGDECASACVFILLGGVQRYAFGSIGVHRTTYSRDISDDLRVANDVDENIKDVNNFVQSMSVSARLSDAINTTESWRTRYLTIKEKREMNVFGTDRVEEELLFNQIARARGIPRKEFIDIFVSNREDCLLKAKKLEMTVFECAKILNLKPPSLLQQAKNWVRKFVERYTNKDSKK
jgi:hypothetical protein